jgi:polyisoprenoid-binding protein YceI
VSLYRIVPERSYVWIDARSNVHPIHSKTNGLEGFIDFEMTPDGSVDLTSRSAGQLSLAVSRLSSGNAMEDRELRRRIDAGKYPKIEGVLEQIAPSGTPGTYRVGGEVIFRGVARRYDDEMTVAALDADTLQLGGKSRFDIRDFGMAPPRVLMFRVQPEVDVTVEIIAARQVH